MARGMAEAGSVQIHGRNYVSGADGVYNRDHTITLSKSCPGSALGFGGCQDLEWEEILGFTRGKKNPHV